MASDHGQVQVESKKNQAVFRHLHRWPETCTWAQLTAGAGAEAAAPAPSVSGTLGRAHLYTLAQSATARLARSGNTLSTSR